MSETPNQDDCRGTLVRGSDGVLFCPDCGWRIEPGSPKYRTPKPTALEAKDAEIASLRAQLDEARRKAIEECILVVKKERRTKVIGPDASPRERAAWDKCRYGTFKSAEGAIRALLSESKT